MKFDVDDSDDNSFRFDDTTVVYLLSCPIFRQIAVSQFNVLACLDFFCVRVYYARKR